MPSLSSRRLDVTTVAAAASATDQNTPGPAEHATPALVLSVVCDPAVSKRKTEAEMRQVLANKKRAPMRTLCYPDIPVSFGILF
jgi:hypothetical protein